MADGFSHGFIRTASERNEIRFWLALVLLTGAGTRSYFVPKRVSYLLCALTIVGLCLYVLRSQPAVILVPVVPLVLLTTIHGPLLVHVLINSSVSVVVRFVTFLVFSVTLLFYLPQYVTASELFHTLSRVGAAFTLIGLPASIFGEYSLLGVQFRAWQWDLPPPLDFVGISPITSVFTNPNVLGLVTVVGTACALYEISFSRGWGMWSRLLLSLNLGGALFSGSRAAVLALAAVGGIHAGYRLLGRSGAIFANLCVFAALASVTAVVLGTPPFGSLASGVNFHGRGELWRGAVESVLAQPQGYGPVDRAEVLSPFVPERWQEMTAHNSFLRMFLSSGVVGGVAYICLSVYVTVNPLRAGTLKGANVSAIAVSVVVLQTFASFSLFGLSLNSIVAGLVFGVAIVHTETGTG